MLSSKNNNWGFLALKFIYGADPRARQLRSDRAKVGELEFARKNLLEMIIGLNENNMIFDMGIDMISAVDLLLASLPDELQPRAIVAQPD